MENFKDIYSSIYFNEDFDKLNIDKRWELLEEQLKNYLKNKIWLKNILYKFDKNVSIYNLVKTASEYYSDEAVADLVHLILNFASNMQGYHIVWYCNEKVGNEPIIVENVDNKWESLNTPKNINYLEIFDFVYSKFYYYFFRNYNNIMLDRFIEYVGIPTNSNFNSKETPSSINQIYFGKKIYFELQKLGFNPIFDKEYGYVYAKLEGDKTIPSIGFIAHIDTCEDAKDQGINPLIISDYTGEDIIYNDKVVLSVKENPDLLNHIGKTLITTDGTTLLGADDKAGVVEIISMLEYYKNNNEDHGDIYAVFTPDEEIGKSIEHLDRSIFRPKYAYTVDGESLGEISYENFNAAAASIKIKGVSTHCGSAKDKMVNSLLLANMLNNLLPKEIPANTSGYQGFYHLEKIAGDVSCTEMSYLIRDFDKEQFELRKVIMQEIVNKLNDAYDDCIDLKISDSYKNMKTNIEKNMEVVDIALKAIEKSGVKPIVEPIRGGTDGTDLSNSGLPCPNLGTGGHNFHSTSEYITLEDMEKVRDILINIVREYYLSYKVEKPLSKLKNR